MKFTHRTRDGRKAYILPEQGTEKRPVLAVVQSSDCKETFYCEAYSKHLKVREVAGGWEIALTTFLSTTQLWS